jgi:hypothetical protein
LLEAWRKETAAKTEIEAANAENTMKLGATGQYPDGKLGGNGEGELRISIGKDLDGNVRLDFCKQVAWMAFPPEQAIVLARMILQHAGAKKVDIKR